MMISFFCLHNILLDRSIRALFYLILRNVLHTFCTHFCFYFFYYPTAVDRDEVEVLLSLQQSTHSEDSREDNDCEILYHVQMKFFSSKKLTKVLNNEQEHIPKGLI